MKTTKEIAALLVSRNEKVVFAESCTAGMVMSSIAQIPGISNSVCGSAVVYRASIKQRWLGVRSKTIKKHTTESIRTAIEMARGVLKNCPEATWGISVVGHLGPNAPAEKDGMVYVVIARRTKKGNIKLSYQGDTALVQTERAKRQEEAVQHVLRCFLNVLEQRPANKV